MAVSQNSDYDELSAGIIVFKYDQSNKKILYLVLIHRENHYDFPKGHVENNENIIEAAKRETYEETGLKEIKIIDDTYYVPIEYTFFNGSKLIRKKVIYFLGFLTNPNEEVKISNEHNGYEWLTYDELIKKLKYKEQKDLLKKMNEKITL
ncbi:MAG: NUDIX domain-containing protein [Candidatus Anstonellales archaeon]